MNHMKLVGLGVLSAAVACLVLMWGLFATMYARGDTEIVLYANRYNEFFLELGLLTLAIVFLPVLLCEFDDWVGN